MISRRKLDDDPGEAAFKLLHGYFHNAPGRVIEHGPPLPEAIQHHKMIIIPEQNTREDPLFLQVRGFHLVSVCMHPIVDRRQAHVVRIGPVPGDSAVLPDLFQGNPFPIIGKDHVQTRCPAFQGFQLHDHRNLCHFFPCHRFCRGFCLIPNTHLPSFPFGSSLLILLPCD